VDGIFFHRLADGSTRRERWTNGNYAGLAFYTEDLMNLRNQQHDKGLGK
jgi:hypothetical protein